MTRLINTPVVKVGLVGVSRDCFPVELTRRRLGALVAACRKRKLQIVPCSTIIESEGDAVTAAAELEHQDVNAAVVYLGNFGPEGPLTVFARLFDRPFMLAGAAEENLAAMIDGRGDAFCGMLNACLNARLRGLQPFVARRPVGLPDEVAADVEHFIDVARVVTGIRHLKTFSFGPRPADFYACNAPIRPLYDLGIEVMENSELDLLELFRSVDGRRKEIDSIARSMARELGAGNTHPGKLRQLAQFELALTVFFDEHLGARQYGVFANKCWPAFEKAFGFVPCFVNSRLAGRGIPAACEVDIYGAVSEYMAQCAGLSPVTILDINNNAPPDMRFAESREYRREDVFLGFHCGNTPSSCLCEGCSMQHQLIMHRLMEPGRPPDITCGTLEGRLKPGPATVFRLQSDRGDRLMSYIGEGRVLDADPSSFGSIGAIGIQDFARFYRYVLLGRQFPHHTALSFRHVGATLFDALNLLGVCDIQTPRPAGLPYPGENPFTV